MDSEEEVREVTVPKRSASSKWKPEFVERARVLAEAGATDREISADLGIESRTFYNYCNVHPEFNEAVKVAKAKADDRVERTLYERAMGYWVEEEKAFLDRKTGGIIKATERKHIPPEPNCLKFWLSCRRPEVYKEISRQELTGAGGSPVQLSNLSDADVARRVAFMLRTGEMALDMTPPVLIDAKVEN